MVGRTKKNTRGWAVVAVAQLSSTPSVAVTIEQIEFAKSSE